MRDARVDSSQEVLTQQAIGVLVWAALRGTARITEIDFDIGGHREALMGMHLLALIPGQQASQLLRQLADVLGNAQQQQSSCPCGDS